MMRDSSVTVARSRTRNTDICDRMNTCMDHSHTVARPCPGKHAYTHTHTLQMWNKNHALKQTSALSMTVPKGPPSVRFKCNIYCQMRQLLLKTTFMRNKCMRVCVCVHRYACIVYVLYIFYILCVVLPYTQISFLLHARLWKPVSISE